MKEQHCYLIKPEKTVMANKKNCISSLETDRVCYQLRFKKQSRHARRRQTGGQAERSRPKTELLQTRLLSLQPGASHNHSHSAVLEYVPWKFRQVSYLWKIAAALSPGTIETKPTNTHTHTQTPSPNLPVHPTLFSIFSNYKSKGVRHYNTCTFRLSKLKVDMLS